MLKYLPLVGLGVAYVSGQFDYVSECPEENGLFADALQCDRYYECEDGVVKINTYSIVLYYLCCLRCPSSSVQMVLSSTRRVPPMQSVVSPSA